MLRHSMRHLVVRLGAVGTCLFVAAWTATSAAQEPASPAPKLTRADVEAMMKSLSNWGRWGDEDQGGALNLITPEKVKQAAAQVTEGRSVSLAHNVVKTGPAAFGHRMTTMPQNTDLTSSADEFKVIFHGYVHTHVDALCHMFFKGRMYNNVPQSEVTEAGGAKLSVINLKQGIITRGVLFDLPKVLGVRFLKGGHAITPADLDACEKATGVKVESGDALLIRTGRWARAEVEGSWNPTADSAGLHASCLPWIKQRDIAVIGSDLALDVFPSGVEGFPLPVHWVVIVAMGMPILDNCDLEALSEATAARKRYNFMLTVAPLAVDGGTGSPANPLATF